MIDESMVKRLRVRTELDTVLDDRYLDSEIMRVLMVFAKACYQYGRSELALEMMAKDAQEQGFYNMEPPKKE